MQAKPTQKEAVLGPALSDVRWFFFDLDGTLADSVSGLQGSIEMAFRAVGRGMPEVDLRQWIGPGIRTILHNLDASLSEPQLDAMEQAFRADYDNQGVLRTDLFAGVSALLQALRQDGRHLVIVTNKPKLATGRLLEKHALAGVFEDVVSRDSRQPVYASKGEMLHDTMHRHRADPGASVMVGDTEEDAAAAMQAGMRFIHAAYGYGICADTAHAQLQDAGELLGMCGLAAVQDERMPRENGR